VLEEGVDVAAAGIAFSIEKTAGSLSDFGAVFGRVIGLAQTDVDERGGQDLGDLELLRFGQAQGGAVLLQELIDLFCEPTGVAELECATNVLR